MKVTKAKRMSRLKKKCHSEWSKIVRKRDGKCIKCGNTKHLAAHHWIFSSARSLEYRYNPNNGCSLCYGCHIHVIHKEASVVNSLFLIDKMSKIITKETFGEIVASSGSIRKDYTEKELELILANLEKTYCEM